MNMWPLSKIGPDSGDYLQVWNLAGDELAVRTGGWRRCQLAGCTGVQVGLRWPDRRITWACTKGLLPRLDGDWQIAH